MKDFQVLVQAIEIAQSKGAYSLQEVGQILPSINAVGQALADASKANEKEEVERPKTTSTAKPKK